MKPPDALEQALKNDAITLMTVFMEFKRNYGEEKTEELLEKAYYKCGRETGKLYSPKARKSAKALANEIMSDKTNRKVQCLSLLRGSGEYAKIGQGKSIHVDTWEIQGLRDDQIYSLDKIHRMRLRGIIEGCGFNVEFPQLISRGSDTTVISIRRAEFDAFLPAFH